MSIANVQSLFAANTNPANVTILVVLTNGTTFMLSPNIPFGGSTKFDLTKVIGLKNGDMFTARVSVPSTGQTANDTTPLTYVTSGGVTAKYTVGGTAIAPSITFDGIA